MVRMNYAKNGRKALAKRLDLLKRIDHGPKIQGLFRAGQAITEFNMRHPAAPKSRVMLTGVETWFCDLPTGPLYQIVGAIPIVKIIIKVDLIEETVRISECVRSV